MAFVGPQNQYEEKVVRGAIANQYLLVEVENFFRWCDAMKHINPKYYHLNHLDLCVENDENKQLLEDLNHQIFRADNVIFMDDQASSNIDDMLQSDAAAVRTPHE